MHRIPIAFAVACVLATATAHPLTASSTETDDVNAEHRATPDPNRSRFGLDADNVAGVLDRIGVSPANHLVAPEFQYFYRVQLLDNEGHPIGGFPASQVALDFSGCLSTNPPLTQIQPDGPSDLDGFIEWRVNLGFGGADPCGVTVRVQGIPFHTIPGAINGGGIRSPDVDGDRDIDLLDFVEFQQAWDDGGPAFIGDLGPSGAFDDLITLDDCFVIAAHSGETTPTCTSTGLAELDSAPSHETARLEVAPNPFNPATTVSFSLARATSVEIRVHDVAGRLVRVLVEVASLEAGVHTATWDGRDARGVAAASGVYFVRMTTNDGAQTRPVVLSK